MQNVIGRDHNEQLKELLKASVKLEKWTLDDWKVEAKFQLNIEKYAEKKKKTLS
jgi:hypothetical protein